MTNNTNTVAVNRVQFEAQLEATISSGLAVSRSVVAAVRSALNENGNPALLSFVITGLDNKNMAARNPQMYKTVVQFINAFVACTKVKNDDGVGYKADDQGNVVLRKSTKRLAKIFEAHEITGYNEEMKATEYAPLIEQLKTKLDEYLETRERGDELDDDEEPSIFAGKKDSRTEEEKAKDKEEKAEEKKVKARKQWDDGGKEKHMNKMKDMNESFMSCIALVLKTYGQTESDLIELLASKNS